MPAHSSSVTRSAIASRTLADLSATAARSEKRPESNSTRQAYPTSVAATSSTDVRTSSTAVALRRARTAQPAVSAGSAECARDHSVAFKNAAPVTSRLIT